MKIIGLLFLTLSFFTLRVDAPQVTRDSELAKVLILLGEEAPKHYLSEIDPELARMGKEMVYEGRTKRSDGSYSNYISGIFVCTDCHNQVKEDPNPATPDPESRLDYAIENNLPFLQATTFHGMVNRESWYNDDYVKKYGDWIAPAKESLYESTQLCARECSSGRTLEEWEAEAINHYYWTLQLRLSDLNLSEEELLLVNKAVRGDSNDQEAAIGMLKSKYMLASPARFVEPPEDRKAGYPNTEVGDPAKGEAVFTKSCTHCHHYGGPSLFTMEANRKTGKLFMKHLERDTPFALYDIVRHGTYAEPGHRQYMPLYTLDRMSHQQLEDLRAYLNKLAEGN